MRYLIYGEADSGKTTTCRKILKALLALGAQAVHYRHVSDSDFEATLSFKGLTVALYSAGDDRNHVRAALDYCADADILVATIRSCVKYNLPLKPYTEGIDYEWRTLAAGASNGEKETLTNALTLEILTEINKII